MSEGVWPRHAPCRVLVLMATRNGSAWIEPQIESIAAQRGDFQLGVAVCDDGSTDDTMPRLVGCAQKLSLPLTVVRTRRAGGSAGRNFFRLIDAADLDNCDFVALADQDDIWNDGKVQRAIDQLRAHGASGYSAAVTAFWPNGRTVVMSQSSRTTCGDHLFEGAGQGCSFVLTAELLRTIRRDLRNSVHVVHLVHYHDWTLYALSRTHDAKWRFDDWSCLQYRQHSANDTGARVTFSGIGRRLHLIRSGWYGEQVCHIAQICARVESPGSGVARHYLSLLSKPSSMTVRWRLVHFTLRHGRRKWSDRLVLAWASLAGHLGRKINGESSGSDLVRRE